MNYLAIAVVTAVLAANALASPPTTTTSAPTTMAFTTEETFLSDNSNEPKFSSDHLHFAYITCVDSKPLLVVDGRKEQPWTSIVTFELSEDGQHYAYIAKDGQEFVLVVDGKPSEKFSYMPTRSFRFDPATGRVLCEAHRGEQTFLLTNTEVLGPYDSVTLQDNPLDPSQSSYAIAHVRKKSMVIFNGQPGEPFDAVDQRDIVISPDRKRYGYLAQEGQWDHRIVVIDGKRVAEYTMRNLGGLDSSGIHAPPIVFSPDSQHVGFGIVSSDKQWMRVDGKDYPAGLYAYQLTFSPDSQHFACILSDHAEGGLSHTLVLDGERQGTYRHVQGLRFSPDSNRILFEADNKDGQFVLVVNGKEGPAFRRRINSSILFSPDNRRMMYTVGDREERHLVVDDQRFGPFQEISSSFNFSPDSKRYGFTAQRDGKWVAIIDGNEEKYHAVGSPQFSADGTSYAYVAREGQQYFMVQDGREGPRYNVVSGPSFSPTGRQMAYSVIKDKQWHLVLNGQDGANYDQVDALTFMPGGHVVYWAWRSKGRHIVIDGMEGPLYQVYYPYGVRHPYGIRPNGDIEYLAQKAGALYHVRHHIVE